MADYSAVRLNPPLIQPTWPPGDINFPTKINNLIDLLETTETEVENARGAYSTLLDNLINTYVNSILINNISGSTSIRFTNMLDASNPEDYVTRARAAEQLSTSTLTDLGFNWVSLNPDIPGTPDDPLELQDPSSIIITLDQTNYPFTTYDVDPNTLSNTGTYFYPSKFNATYFLDWSLASNTIIALDRPLGTIPIPKLGDRLRFIFKDVGINDGIQASTRKIMNLTEVITFGSAYTYVVYDIVYSSVTRGWFFTNVITGT